MSPVEENEQALLVKDEENFPTLEASAQVKHKYFVLHTNISKDHHCDAKDLE